MPSSSASAIARSPASGVRRSCDTQVVLADEHRSGDDDHARHDREHGCGEQNHDMHRDRLSVQPTQDEQAGESDQTRARKREHQDHHEFSHHSSSGS